MRSNEHLRIFPIDSGWPRKTKSSIRGNRRRIPCHIFSIIIPAPDDTYSSEAHLWARSTSSQTKWLTRKISFPVQHWLYWANARKWVRAEVGNLHTFTGSSFSLAWLLVLLICIYMRRITSWNFHNNFTVHDFIAIRYSIDLTDHGTDCVTRQNILRKFMFPTKTVTTKKIVLFLRKSSTFHFRLYSSSPGYNFPRISKLQ